MPDLQEAVVRILAVDPGEAHIGFAYFEDDAKDWHLVTSWEETDRWEAIDTIRRYITEEDLDFLVVEEFRLYPGRTQAQSWKKMETSEMIGAIKWIVREAQRHGFIVSLVEQGANIKKPTRGVLKGRGIKRMEGTGNHAADAQLHGWHWILRREGEKVG